MRRLYNGYDLVRSSALPHCKHCSLTGRDFLAVFCLWERDVCKVTEQPLFAGSLKLAGTSVLAGELP